MKTFIRLSFFMTFLIFSCQKESQKKYPSPEKDLSKLFTSVPSSYSGINFKNVLDVNKLMSPLQYINVYNGGGVAVGDIDNDGLTDIFFTGNLSDNKLYINKGGFKFEDITLTAGVASPNSWSTGACMIDINNDGWLDIYVCRSYYKDPKKRENQLFINNGDRTFTEQAASYGLNDNGYSIMASFFDYDKNGLLDVFVGNHPKERFIDTADHYDNWLNPRLESSNHLYKNLGNGKFINTTVIAGVLSYGWTLGMVTVDLDQDDWPDIFVTVDHDEPDLFYINNKNGTFREVSRSSLKHLSLSSMGVDAGDINNDGLLDVVTVEMLAADNYRAKTQMVNMKVRRFWEFVTSGYNYQYMRNMLHVNNGNGTFREVGQLSKIHKTDWSWASLFMDMDNDGWQDLYITNGYFKDFSDKDYKNSFNNKLVEADKAGNNNEKIRLLNNHSKDASSTKLKNYMFRNNGDYTFEDVSFESGLDFKGFSSGAAYADFDNDGDLDIVVNNINDEASLYTNNSSDLPEKNNWLRILFKTGKKGHAIGTKVKIETENGTQFREHVLTRGYQSSVEDALHFGLGKVNQIKKLEVQWPDGKSQLIYNISVNQVLILDYKDATSNVSNSPVQSKLFTDLSDRAGLTFNHKEAYYDDYAVQMLLPHQMSCFGPAIAIGDINNDGLEDLYLGGAQNQSGAIFIQNENGIFNEVNLTFLELDKTQEDLAAAFFDADGDGDLDLYVVSGGNEQPKDHDYYRDRFYLNNGDGSFIKSNDRIPKIVSSGSCVKPFDFDGDGDLDLFIGSRHIPGKYPFAPQSYLLENIGGTFKDVTKQIAKPLLELGMVTDAIWTDLNNDGIMDLMVVGEWMPITFLIQKNGKFINLTAEMGMAETRGWWNCINRVDLDGDGDEDYVLGNLGLNYSYQVSPDKPFHIYATDFDNNGSNDIVLGYINNQTLFPVRGKSCSTEQIPELAKRFSTYDAFGRATLEDIYGDKLKDALHYEINTFESSFLFNEGNGIFILKPLPTAAQSSPINGILSMDFDGDGFLDLLMAGNMHVSEIETGRSDSGIGFFLKGDGKGGFEAKYAIETGFFARGYVKHLEMIKTNQGKHYIIVVKNNGDLQIVELNFKFL
ncbi:MAG: VCBS repeat-containing protein [Bacteroidetes bacterium]|nr:VCBS repeat-containing protein [Bacteroidota bacterium]